MSRDNIAVDSDGNILPFNSEQVQAVVDEGMAGGKLLAVVMVKDERIMVQVVGLPSQELLDALESATKAYRKVLKGH